MGARLLGGFLAALALVRATFAPPRGVAAAPPALEPSGDGQRPPPGGLQNPSIFYEHSDVKFGWILGLVVAAVIAAVIVLYVVYRFWLGYGSYEARVKRSAFPLATENGGLPPEPRLEQLNRLAGVTRSDVYLRLEAKEQLLHEYGPLPEEKGYVRVPIEQAMDYLAQDGRLPARPQQIEPRQNGLVFGGGPNSGRLFREKAPWFAR
jgi:hypothetical protein